MSFPMTGEYLTLHEIIRKARQNLNENHWQYIVGGTESEATLRRNRWSIDRLALRPRVLRDVSDVDPGIDWFGKRLNLPLMFAPVGGLEHFWETGPIPVTQAAGAWGVPHMLSSVCVCDFEQVAAASPEALKIFQLYVHGDAQWVDEITDRVIGLGFSQFCLTVDSAVYSRRERDLAQRNIRRANVPGREWQAKLTWHDVKRIRQRLKLPLMLKGIATAEDARIALDHGIDVIYVSNHGGRQLDQGQGAMEVLPEIVAAVDGKSKIIVDGGFCRGTDVVKAIAAGADMVAMGRMQCIALAAGGKPALLRLLELLDAEIRIAMALCGVSRLDALDPSYLCLSEPLLAQHTWGAFPLLDESLAFQRKF
ncbi:MAG: alpha-hydroxy-acid oxidizing protein [Betaproteobacteria bacterium]|nr:alpha-hydroxy-acid oxidizing protein [Betaproteobacteria bacterium]